VKIIKGDDFYFTDFFFQIEAYPISISRTEITISRFSISRITKLIDDLNQVRTRAVTARGYINSKEDILIYATKLLKAEMPLSLRLMGKFVCI